MGRHLLHPPSSLTASRLRFRVSFLLLNRENLEVTGGTSQPWTALGCVFMLVWAQVGNIGKERET